MESTLTNVWSTITGTHTDCEKVVKILDLIVDGEASSEDQQYFYSHVENARVALRPTRRKISSKRFLKDSIKRKAVPAHLTHSIKAIIHSLPRQLFNCSMPGKIVLFAAPSGAGKTTIVKHLLKVNPNLSFSISACTRDKRGRSEENGKDYYFITPEEFRQKIENDEFVEWEEVYEGAFYGTLKSEIQRIWDMGKTPFWM